MFMKGSFPQCKWKPLWWLVWSAYWCLKAFMANRPRCLVWVIPSLKSSDVKSLWCKRTDLVVLWNGFCKALWRRKMSGKCFSVRHCLTTLQNHGRFLTSTATLHLAKNGKPTAGKHDFTSGMCCFAGCLSGPQTPRFSEFVCCVTLVNDACGDCIVWLLVANAIGKDSLKPFKPKCSCWTTGGGESCHKICTSPMLQTIHKPVTKHVNHTLAFVAMNSGGFPMWHLSLNWTTARTIRKCKYWKTALHLHLHKLQHATTTKSLIPQSLHQLKASETDVHLFLSLYIPKNKTSQPGSQQASKTTNN